MSILKHGFLPSSLHDAMIQHIFLKGPRILSFLPITMKSHLRPPSVKSSNWQFY